jgi:hypothetical protein
MISYDSISPEMTTIALQLRCFESELLYDDVLSEENAPATESDEKEALAFKDKLKAFFEKVKEIFTSLIEHVKKFYNEHIASKFKDSSKIKVYFPLAKADREFIEFMTEVSKVTSKLFTIDMNIDEVENEIDELKKKLSTQYGKDIEDEIQKAKKEKDTINVDKDVVSGLIKSIYGLQTRILSNAEYLKEADFSPLEGTQFEKLEENINKSKIFATEIANLTITATDKTMNLINQCIIG